MHATISCQHPLSQREDLQKKKLELAKRREQIRERFDLSTSRAEMEEDIW